MSAPLAAKLLGKLEAEEAELGTAGEQLAGEFPRRLPLVDVRSDLVADEAGDSLPQLLVLLAEGREGGAGAAVLDDGHPASSSIVWPRPSWSKPSRSPCGFFLPPWW